MNVRTLIIVVLAAAAVACPGARQAPALDYAYNTAEPQKTGWPLTEEEEKYVLKPEFERRPGKEQSKHLPAMWPVTPNAGSFGGRSWLDTHAKLTKMVEENKGPVDVLLVGDSITIQWGDSWKRNFPTRDRRREDPERPLAARPRWCCRPRAQGRGPHDRQQQHVLHA